MGKQISEYITEWSQKLSIPVKDIEKDFQLYLTEENEIHADLTEDERKLRALNRLALLYKKQLRSPAVGFEGVIIGLGDCIDIVAKQKHDAIEMFKKDPQLTVSQGFTDATGVPLDTRKEWTGGRKNAGYGKPLPEHNYLRNVYGYVVKSKVENDTPKFFSMSLSGKLAQNETIPLFVPVRFMAIDKTPKEASDIIYILNPSSFTTINLDKDLKLPNLEEIMEGDIVHFVNIGELPEYHQSMKDVFGRVVITEGSVSSLKLEPTSVGSRIMTIEDENLALEDIEANNGVTCWIPPRVNIDFAEGSKVLVIGRTVQGKKKDEAGNLTDELGDITINVFGIYAEPDFKIELPDIEPLTEENI